MLKKEIASHSPWRILEEATHGGVKPGEIGALVGPKGVGKTACLVHLATYNLLLEKPVIHVSYARRVDYILTWYEDIFRQVARRRNIPYRQAEELLSSLARHRVIMNFHQDATQTNRVLRSLEAMIKDGNFPAELIIVDGYDFQRGTAEELYLFKKFASRVKTSLWFSVSTPRDDTSHDKEGWPLRLKPYHHLFDVVLTLKSEANTIGLSVLKDHEFSPSGELPVRFDPQSLLVVTK